MKPAVAATAPEKRLLEFIHLLRQVGLRISTAEVIDALQALTWISLADKAQVRAALRATLVKDSKEVAAFEEAFSAFFAAPATKRRMVQQVKEAEAWRQRELAKAEAELVFQGEPLALTEDDKLFYAQLASEQKARLQRFLHETSTGKNVDHHFRPLVTSLVKSHLAYLRRQGGRANGAPWAELGAGSGKDPLAVWVERNCGFWRQDVQEIAPSDLPRAQALVAELSRRLATRISRRYRQSTRARVVDLRRSLRYNLRYGGALFCLKYRRRRQHKPQLLLLCDVSGSMARYSFFTMQFLYGLGRAVRRSRCFLFAERSAELDLKPLAGQPLAALAERLEQHQEVLGRQTRLDVALQDLLERHRDLLTRRTVLVVVSDTKTQDAARAASLMAQMRGWLKAILWFNPLPEGEWRRYPTVAVFQDLGKMLPCRTIGDLERLLRCNLWQIAT